MNRPALVARRRPQRLRDYNYGSPGAYFVTLCAHERKAVFAGDTVGIILEAWQAIPKRFPGVQVDSFVVMPNHVHGIITVTAEGRAVGQEGRVAAERGVGEAREPPLQTAPTPMSLRQERSRMLVPAAVGFFKTNAAKRINLLRGTPGSPVWQRGYYEHVIRTEAELARIRQYIQVNPTRWEEDPENPAWKAHTPCRGGSRAAPTRRW